MNYDEQEAFFKELGEIKKKLDRLDMELAMEAEAIESIDISLRLLKTELDFEEERENNDYRS